MNETARPGEPTSHASAKLAADVIGVYERNAAEFDAVRSRSLIERRRLEAFLRLAPGRRILDLGCGAGEPVSAWLLARGAELTGIDASAAMIALARPRLPAADLSVADMRRLPPGEPFDGIVSWDSFFHLSADDQRKTLPRIVARLRPGGALLINVGPEAGERIGRVADEPVFHASLSPAEYADLLDRLGVDVVDFAAEDPDVGGRSVLLARRRER